MRTRQARQQQDAVNVILANQGKVIYDSDIGESYLTSPPNRRQWLRGYHSSIPSRLSLSCRRPWRAIVGRHFVDKVVQVTVPIDSLDLSALLHEFNQTPRRNSSNTQSQLIFQSPLVQDSRFTWFVLNCCSLSDVEWKTVLKLKSLERISGIIPDDDPRHLAELSELQSCQSDALKVAQYLVSPPDVPCTFHIIRRITLRFRDPIFHRPFDATVNRHPSDAEVKPPSFPIEL